MSTIIIGRDGVERVEFNPSPTQVIIQPVTDNMDRMTGFAYSWAGHIHPAGGDEGRVIYDQRYPDGCPICGTIA